MVKTIETLNEKNLNKVGVALSLRGKTLEAIQVYERALEMNPYYHCSHYNLAAEYIKVGFIEDAIVEYERYLAYNPYAEDREKVLKKIHRLVDRAA